MRLSLGSHEKKEATNTFPEKTTRERNKIFLTWKMIARLFRFFSIIPRCITVTAVADGMLDFFFSPPPDDDGYAAPFLSPPRQLVRASCHQDDSTPE